MPVQEGDVVKLKSGGLIMTVGRVYGAGNIDASTTCYWVHEGVIVQTDIPMIALEKYNQ